MSQIFHHTANIYAKMSLVLVALLLGFAGNSAPDHVDQLHALPVWLKWLR